MGQLLFQYMFNPILETVNQFQYHWEKTTEYGLYYKRYAALSDASIFDAPVAITKVATGVSRIQDLFSVDKSAHPSIVLSSLFARNGEIEKKIKSTVEDSLIPVKEKNENRIAIHVSGNTLRRKLLFTDEETFDGMFIPNANEFRVQLQDFTDYVYWFPENNYLSMLPEIFMTDSTWKHLSRFNAPEWMKREWNLDRIPEQERLTFPREHKDINLYDIIFMTPPTNNLVIREDVIAWTYGPILDRYYTEVVDRINDNDLSMYQIKYACKRTEAGYSIYPQEFMRLKFLNHLNIYENISGSPERRDIGFEFYQRFGKFKNRMFSWTDNLFGKKTPPSWKTYDVVPGGTLKRVGMSILPTVLGGNSNIHADLWEQVFCDRQNEFGRKFSCNIFDFSAISPGGRSLNAFQALLGKPNKRYAQYQRYDYMGQKPPVSAILDGSVHYASRVSYKAQSYNRILSGVRAIEDRSVALNQCYWGIKSIQPVSILSLDDFSIREKKSVFTINGVSACSEQKPIGIGSYLLAYRSGRPIMEGQVATGRLIDKHMVLNQEIWTFKGSHNIYLDDYFQLGAIGGSHGKIVWENADLFSIKDRLNADLFTQLWTSSPIKRLNISIDIDLMAGKDRHEMGLFRDADGLFGGKSYKDIDVWRDELAIKIGKDFSIQDTSTGTFKVKHGFSIKDSSTLIQKIRKGFVIGDIGEIIHKESKEMYFEMVHLWFAYKIPKDFIIMPWDVLADKVKKDFRIMDTSGLIYKDRKPIPDTDRVVSAIKSAFSFVVGHGFDHPSWEDVGGFIVPISKVRKSMVENDIDVMASKVFKDVMISEGKFASVIAEDMRSMLGKDLVGIDKIPHGVFIDYQNEGIIKSKVHSAIHDDYVTAIKTSYEGMLQESVWTSKGYRPLQVDSLGQVSGEKQKKPGMIELTGVWLSRGIKHLSTFDIVSLEKKYSNLSTFEVVSGSSKRIMDASIFKEYWLEKLPNLCYYSYGEWLKKEHSCAVVYEQGIDAQKKNRNMVLTFADSATRKHLKAWYDEYLVGDSVIRQGELANELEWLEKTRRRCGIHPNDFGNWVWVYETPDPFQDAFGIDELLLPENDTHYENFKELIFDSVHMRPRKPVREISDTQWVAKYPIKHPTQKWADVAVDYDASAIDWENYYGIETSIMHDMFLRYYRIWTAKMFEFSTMTMQQSVNLMLEYLWAWIPEYFPINKLEEAYRVFKLIRWFGEAAIINNSQYIISYEYDNGGMKMKEDPKTHKKVWGIYGLEVNLKDCDSSSTNDTMFLDRQQYVIRNNPVYVGHGSAWVEFILEAKRNTTVSFTLMNTVGSVNIYVDDVLVDTRSKTGKVIIPIQYTGDEVTIRLEKDKNNNLNDQFMIGNLTVPQQDFKDLTIEFDPQLRAGNKPLDEIAKKLIGYAMLHDQRNTAWSEALKANLGVSEVYKKMTRYWEDHHAGKIKGKRLTIKQV